MILAFVMAFHSAVVICHPSQIKYSISTTGFWNRRRASNKTFIQPKLSKKFQCFYFVVTMEFLLLRWVWTRAVQTTEQSITSDTPTECWLWWSLRVKGDVTSILFCRGGRSPPLALTRANGLWLRLPALPSLASRGQHCFSQPATGTGWRLWGRRGGAQWGRGVVVPLKHRNWLLERRMAINQAGKQM